MATDDTIEVGIHSGNIAKAIAGLMGGGGGGNPKVAQAGGKNAEQLPEALAATEGIIRESLSGQTGD
jgi:alanyl-tRNA synthetase